MSDGDNDATPDHRRTPGAANGQQASPGPQSALGAAPWERFSEPPSDQNAHRWQAAPPFAQPVEPEAGETEKGGSHAGGGPTVADLIAKLGAPMPDRPGHHHVAPDTESCEAAPDLPVDEQPTQLIDTPAYLLDAVSELPDLDATDYPDDEYPDDDEPEFDLIEAPTASRPAPASKKTAKSRESKPKSRRRPMLLAARSTAALFAVLALALTGGAWQWSTSKNARLNTVSALDPNSGDIRDPNGQYGDEDFLIVGIDSRAGENADMGAGSTDDADGARSDTVMLVNIPANRKRVVAVSFPRDLAITPIQCEAWNPDTGEYGPLYDSDTKKWGPRNVYTETKLNSTFSFGGPKCLVKEIQKLSGLSINRFIAIDFVGFAKMVDALGGVEVCSTRPLYDYELGTVLAHSGRQRIDSKTALNYVRARNVNTENNGDYGRIKRQQLFLSSLLRSLISQDTFFSLDKLNNVVNTFIKNSYVDNVKTKDLVQLGQSVQGMSAGHVSFVTVPTGITDENGDEPPRTSDMRALFDAIINDDPLPGENDLNATSSPPTKSLTSKAPQAKPSPSTAPRPEQVQAMTTAPHDVTVQVSNSTAKSGLATTASSQLKHQGFKLKTPDDYPDPLKST